MTEKILEVKNIQKKFGKRAILKGIDFSIKKGEVLVLLGASGSGKSTLLRTLNGLETMDQGEVFFKGEEIEQTEKSWEKYRQEIGMVFQNYELFPNLNVLENLLLGPLKVKKQAREKTKALALTYLKRVGLLDKATSYPRELSGGQKQRVAITRALMMQPEVLLLDEITASLDPEMVREVLLVVQDLAKEGKTMLIVTHEMNFAKLVADRIIFLEEGKILCDKSVDDFFNNQDNERIQNFLQSLNF